MKNSKESDIQRIRHILKAFRNFLAHEYFGISMWMVWNAIMKDLPELKLLVERIYSDYKYEG